MYRYILKRLLDFVLSLMAIIVLSPLMLIISLLIRIKLGHPVIFSQKRPGKNMKICNYHKFRSMTDERDKYGNLLSDGQRLTPFGEKLRSTSFDELPQLFDILIGRMSIVGPRPQTIENIYFMSNEQKKRQKVTPGLTGLAQVKGRNSITWDERVFYDLKYIKKITFLGDLKILFQTVGIVFSKKGITQEGNATFETMGEYLLRTNQITEEYYLKRKSEIDRGIL